MATLLVHRQILKHFHRLPSKVQKRVSELIEEFQQDPFSDAIGLHPLQESMLDPKVRGVRKLPDGYRAIVIAPEKGDTYLLIHIDDEETYLTTVRSGRPRISRQQRRAAWPVFRAFQRGLKKRNLLTFEGAIHEARLAVEQGNFTRYAHVLVDEVQDFSLEALRLIRAMSPIEEATPDPLCTAGDGHQRIYRTKIPMSRAGIDIRGRSRRLKINYRTSEQIRKFAQGILKGLEIDDLDGGVTTTIGDHSVFKGPEPIIQTCKDGKAEADAIVAWVQMLLQQHGLATHEICVTPYKAAIRTALTAADIATFELKPREADPGSDEAGVRMGTMKRIKGLEFRAVALACSDPGDPMNFINEAEIRERCERYVAASRAREHLFIAVADKKRN
jgi:superfamily I DNA/RNA helicase